MSNSISKYSYNKLHCSLRDYNVVTDFAHSIANYLLYGFQPGGFMTSILANNCLDAFSRSHPNNDMIVLKRVGSWIYNNLVPDIHYGSYSVVNKWLSLSDEDRRVQLEKYKLIYTREQEMILILKDAPVDFNFPWGE